MATILAPLTAEAPSPIPMSVFTGLSVIGIIASFFVIVPSKL